MASCKMTLIGMSNFDATLFDDMVMPSGVDKQLVIDSMLLKGGEFEVLYSSVPFMKMAIKTVSMRWNRTFKKWYDALQLEYNPIDNYDRYEEYTDEKSGTAKINGNTVDSSTASGNINNVNTTSAYDASDYQPHDKSESGSSNTSNSNTTTNSTNQNDELIKHTGHLRGNIGVTTSQQMLESELNIDTWNLYNHISDVMLSELVIPIY